MASILSARQPQLHAVSSSCIFALGVSSGRTDMESLAFMKKVLALSAGNPVFIVDRGPWYTKAFKRLNLRLQHMTRGLRNYIEQCFAAQGED